MLSSRMEPPLRTLTVVDFPESSRPTTLITILLNISNLKINIPSIFLLIKLKKKIYSSDMTCESAFRQLPIRNIV